MAYVTMADLAREVGLSRNAVSLALRGDPSIPPATRERIRAAANRLGYSVNPTVAQLMSELRKSGIRRARHTLALCNAYPERTAFRSHPTLPTYVAGCRQRATQQGYGIDEFWLHDPTLDGDRFNEILHARGIRGLIVIGMMEENRLPARFATTWARHACVVTGVRTHEPTLSFCCVDHHALVLQAVEAALALGYRRPGLVLDARIDRLVEGRFSAGMWVGQQALPPRQRVKSFVDVSAAHDDPAPFFRWLEKEKPDVIFTLYHRVRRWVESRGLRVPQDIGLIQLERRRERDDWAGMDQHNDRTGEAAVDMLISMLQNQESGVPEYPRATLIGATWVDGATVQRQ